MFEKPHFLGQTTLLASLLFLAFLTGCATLIVQDPSTKALSVGERFARFHEKRLAYFQQTAFDSRGNTLTHQDLKELFEKEDYKEALKQLEIGFSPKILAVTTNLFMGAATAFYAYKANEQGGQKDPTQMAPLAWGMLSGLFFTTAGINFFSKNFTVELMAINIYNRDLAKRMGVPIHVIEPAIY